MCGARSQFTGWECRGVRWPAQPGTLWRKSCWTGRERCVETWSRMWRAKADKRNMMGPKEQGRWSGETCGTPSLYLDELLEHNQQKFRWVMLANVDCRTWRHCPGLLVWAKVDMDSFQGQDREQPVPQVGSQQARLTKAPLGTGGMLSPLCACIPLHIRLCVHTLMHPFYQATGTSCSIVQVDVLRMAFLSPSMEAH